MGDYDYAKSRCINDEMASRANGPGPAYVNQDRPSGVLGGAPRGEGLGAVDTVVDMLHASMHDLEMRIDQLYGRLHLPPIYDVPQPTKPGDAREPVHRIGFLLERLNALGVRVSAATEHLSVFTAKLD